MVLQDNTPSRLLDTLTEEVKRLFHDRQYYVKDKDGKDKLVTLNVYNQAMPIRYSHKSGEIPYPNVEVKLVQGFTGDSGEDLGRKICNCLLVFGIEDYDEESYKLLLSMYEQVYLRFAEDRWLGKFEETGQGMFEMQSNPEETWPHSFLACTLAFRMPRVEAIDYNGLC